MRAAVEPHVLRDVTGGPGALLPAVALVAGRRRPAVALSASS
jgi:hypothetical protein